MSISVKWLGHASFMIKTRGKAIYIDPCEGEYAEKADLILVTHSHHDHCDMSKIDMIRRDETAIVAPADCIPERSGKVKSLKPGENAVMGNIAVEAVEAYNYKRFRSPGVPYQPKGLGVGYVITLEGASIYHAGDSDFIPEMKQLRLKNIDVALLPSGGTYTMDNPEAMEATLAIQPKAVIPMHRWDADPEEFKRALETRSQNKVVMLKPGHQFTL